MEYRVNETWNIINGFWIFRTRRSTAFARVFCRSLSVRELAKIFLICLFVIQKIYYHRQVADSRDRRNFQPNFSHILSMKELKRLKIGFTQWNRKVIKYSVNIQYPSQHRVEPENIVQASRRQRGKHFGKSINWIFPPLVRASSLLTNWVFACVDVVTTQHRHHWHSSNCSCKYKSIDFQFPMNMYILLLQRNLCPAVCRSVVNSKLLSEQFNY